MIKKQINKPKQNRRVQRTNNKQISWSQVNDDKLEFELMEGKTLALRGELEVSITKGQVRIDGYSASGEVHIATDSFVNLRGNAVIEVVKIKEFEFLTEEQTIMGVDSSWLESSSLMVMGPKNSGKSTWCYLAVNQLLNEHGEVFVLDTDLGQPFSWGIPGFVTLYLVRRPWFVCAPEVVFQGFVGEFASLSQIELMLGQVRRACRLLEERNVQGRPLVCNTPGFITSYGLTVLQELNKIVLPHTLLLLGHGKAEHFKAQFLRDSFFEKTMLKQLKQKFVVIDPFTEQLNEQQLQHYRKATNPQAKKNRRNHLLLKALGLTQGTLYRQICLTPCQGFRITQLEFVRLGYGLEFGELDAEYYVKDVETIQNVFTFSLVCIENQDKCGLGIGLVKDFTNDEIFLISPIQLESGYRIVKSRDFELAKELFDTSMDSLIEDQDYIQIITGKPLDDHLSIPYMMTTSLAVGSKGLTIKRKL